MLFADKDALLIDKCLIPFHVGTLLILAVDSSSFDLGAVLSHKIGSVERSVFAYKRLNKVQ